MNISTWRLPEGCSANKSESMLKRIEHYRFKLNHYLPDGTQVIPKVVTLKHVLNAYDEHGLRIAISANSYRLKD